MIGGLLEKPGPENITQLLRAWRSGEPEALDTLVPLVYRQMRTMAAHYLNGERQGHSMQATALVHEVYLRLVDSEVPWEDRAHFFAVAARIMRRILVDHAREKQSAGRGGNFQHISLEDSVQVSRDTPPQLLLLDEAMTKLAGFDERKSQIVEMLYFGGLTYDEAASTLNIGTSTLHRELQVARAWLYRELRGEEKT